MRSDVVDAVVFAADNTMVAGRVRMSWQPPVRELGETDDRYVIGTAEVLSSPQQRGMETESKKCDRNPNG